MHDAKALAENLGIQYDIVPIESIYESYTESLKSLFWAQPFNVTEENIQARIRGMLLMAMSNNIVKFKRKSCMSGVNRGLKLTSPKDTS